MKIPSFPRVVLTSLVLVFSAGLQAQTPAPKAAAPAPDPAAAEFDAFFKLRDLPGAAPTGKRFEQVIAAGLPLVAKYPKHRRTPEVIRRLTDVASGFNDKATVPMRDVWFSQLKLAILNVPGDPLDDDGRAALAALKAANANAEARLSREKDPVEVAREKIDALAAMPGGQRFVADAEMGFIEVIKTRSPDAAEKMARKLMEHPDKGLAGRAADEVRIMEARKGPFDLKVTTLDGKAFDAAALRGKKALFLFFWSADNESSVKELETLKEIYFEHRERLEIVSVNLDSADNRAKVDAVLKDKKMKWPQLVEGVGIKSETAARINVRGAPNGALIDKAGMLVLPRARAWQLVGALKAMGFKF
jgi:thiol-disulfide isomerase/thioredoxin